MPSRMLKLRGPDYCAGCASPLSAGTHAHWDAEARTVTCVACLVGSAEYDVAGLGCASTAYQRSASVAPPMARAPIERGTAGASAAREYERRKRNREHRTRQAHPHIGGLLLALRGQPQHEVAFRRGALGEAAVAESLERRTADSATVLLHDRLMPGGHGNIDHLAVAPTGIFVIDAKDWQGQVRVATPLFGKSKLLIAGRDCTKLIDGLDRQVAAVAMARPERWPVQGVLCFTRADLPLFGTTKMRSHLLLYRSALAKRLNARGAFSASEIEATALALATAFPPA